MTPVISIIVPVYKVEAYLQKCIDSILNQTYSDFEIILVDDGSPDHCGVICDEYVKKDARIKVIHKKNGGISSARNAGLDIAQGQYIGFIDSDDWVEKDMYETLLTTAKEYDAEIVECNYYLVKDNEIIGSDTGKIEVGDNVFALKRLLENTSEDVLWNKLYKRELFLDIQFPEGKIYEDSYTMYKLFIKTKKFVSVGRCKYYYLKREGSIMQQQATYSLKNLDYLGFIEERFWGLQTIDTALRDKAQYQYYKNIMYHYYCLSKSAQLDPNRKYRKILETKFLPNYNEFMSNCHMNRKDKLYLFLARLNETAFYWIYHFIFTLRTYLQNCRSCETSHGK